MNDILFDFWKTFKCIGELQSSYFYNKYWKVIRILGAGVEVNNQYHVKLTQNFTKATI